MYALYSTTVIYVTKEREKNVCLVGKILIKKFSDFIETFVLKKKKKKIVGILLTNPKGCCKSTHIFIK